MEAIFIQVTTNLKEDMNKSVNEDHGNVNKKLKS